MVDISIGSATADDWLLQRLAELVCHLFELIVPQIAEQMRWLRVLHGRLNDIDIVRDVPVRGKDIQLSVQVLVKEETAEG